MSHRSKPPEWIETAVIKSTASDQPAEDSWGRGQGGLIVLFRLLAVAALLTGISWCPAAPLPLHWWSRGAGGGGAFFSPSLSPLDPGALYLSTDMGTVFHSANGGALWDSYAFSNLQGGRLARMQFTSDPSVLYILDGRVDYLEYLGGAIFKSVDSGSSWFRLTSDPSLNNDATRKKLRSDPARTDHLILGHDRGLWFSSDGGTHWTAFYNPGSGCYLADAFFRGSNVFAAGNFGLEHEHRLLLRDRCGESGLHCHFLHPRPLRKYAPA